MKISLTGKLDQFVRRKVRDGSYESANEVVCDGLHVLEQRDRIVAGTTSYLSSGSGDIESLILVVMMQATKDADEDIRMIMEEVKSVIAAKRKLRQLVCKVRRDISDNRGGERAKRQLKFYSNGMTSELAYHRVPLAVPDCASPGGVKFVSTDLHKGTIDDVAQLESILEDLQAKLDGMNEMSEMTSLRLQIMMDRRSKFLSTLSNIMKKISETQDTLVQNLK